MPTRQHLGSEMSTARRMPGFQAASNKPAVVG